MEDRFRSEKEKKSSNKKQKQKHPNSEQHQKTTTTSTTTAATSISFKPSSDVKGLKFGGQFIVKSFTVRRASTRELSLLLNHNQNDNISTSTTTTTTPPQLFPSTISFIPTNFTILAHHAWHTLTLGLGTKKSKVIIFVFDTTISKSNAELTWPSEIPLGEVNKRLIKGLTASEIARFKFRKGCVTFYVFGVRKKGNKGFQCGDDLRNILQLVVQLKDFLDHTVMLALPNQRSINYSTSSHSHSVAAH